MCLILSAPVYGHDSLCKKCLMLFNGRVGLSLCNKNAIGTSHGAQIISLVFVRIANAEPVKK